MGTFKGKRGIRPIPLPNKGDLIKVHLPGEAVWGFVVAKHKDGRVAVRLDNHPICDQLHSYKYNDVVTFERHKKFHSWELVPEQRQLLKAIS